MSETTVEWVTNAHSCAEAAARMLDRNVGLLPVKDADRNYRVGVITDRDLVTRVAANGLDPSTTRVENAMTTGILAMVYEDADISAAERLMIDRSVRRLLVLRRSDNVVSGILSVDDFARAGLRRRAGEIIRGSASLAAPPEQRAEFLHPIGHAKRPVTNVIPDVHESMFKVRDIMSGAVEWILETETCLAAAQKMLTRAVGCLPVCTTEINPVLTGIITDRDITIRVIADGRRLHETLVKDVMSRDVACCYTDDNLADAEKLMTERCVRRLPVLKRTNSELIGIISVDDIALSASRGRAGRVIEQVSSRPNEVFMSASVIPHTQRCDPSAGLKA
jgi:CBS domain-containing protein